MESPLAPVACFGEQPKCRGEVSKSFGVGSGPTFFLLDACVLAVPSLMEPRLQEAPV